MNGVVLEFVEGLTRRRPYLALLRGNLI